MKASLHISPRVRLLAAAAIVAGVLYAGFVIAYQRPMERARGRLSAAQTGVDVLLAKLSDEKQTDQELEEIGRRTLGQKRDAVEHRLSAGLRGIAERCGLSGVVVAHGELQKEPNPLARMPRVKVEPAAVKKALAATPDFYVLRGDIAGQGKLDQALRALSEVDSQPWLRVESFSLVPIGGKDGQLFKLKVDVAVAYAPDLLKGEIPEPVLTDDRAESGPVWRTIALRNPFRDPPKTVVAQAPIVVTPTPDKGTPAAANPPTPPLPLPPPPYAEWKITGVIRAPQTGVQVMLTNTRTNSNVTVIRGASVEDAVLMDAGSEQATFRIGDKLFTVRVGQNLSQRVPQG